MPGLLAHALVLLRCERLWTEKVTIYSNHGMNARDVPYADRVVFGIGALVTVYWLSFIPAEYIFFAFRPIGMRAPSEVEKSCIMMIARPLLVITRTLILLTIYAGLFFFY